MPEHIYDEGKWEVTAKVKGNLGFGCGGWRWWEGNSKG
jgi:hypothetical protein